jgi:AhpD family alkylhydroperoxidase
MTIRYVTILVVVATVFGGELATAQAPKPQPQRPTGAQSPSPSQSQSQPRPTAAPTAAMDPATMRDIEATFGFVPQFLRAVPAALLPSYWQGLKNFEMSTETRLDGKTKELIGIAVAAQIPCDYCLMFHSQAARSNGATEEEIREAVGMSALTREGSTLLNGMMVDKAQFRKDLDRMMKQSRQQAKR